MMKTEVSLNKLKQILASRYGKALRLQTLTALKTENEEADYFLRGRDLHIPLKTKTAYLGTAIIPEAWDLTTEGQNEVADMVRLILEPHLYQAYLQRKEENLTKEQFSSQDSHQDLLSNALLLTGTTPEKMRRLSLLAHEISGRWAFLPFHDVQSQLKTSQDFRDLGEVTILIEGFEGLSLDAQGVLLSWLRDSSHEKGPFLIFTSTLSLSALERETQLRPDLIDELALQTLEFDRLPLDEKTLKEILALMTKPSS